MKTLEEKIENTRRHFNNVMDIFEKQLAELKATQDAAAQMHFDALEGVAQIRDGLGPLTCETCNKYTLGLCNHFCDTNNSGHSSLRKEPEHKAGEIFTGENSCPEKLEKGSMLVYAGRMERIDNKYNYQWFITTTGEAFHGYASECHEPRPILEAVPEQTGMPKPLIGGYAREIVIDPIPKEPEHKEGEKCDCPIIDCDKERAEGAQFEYTGRFIKNKNGSSASFIMGYLQKEKEIIEGGYLDYMDYDEEEE